MKWQEKTERDIDAFWTPADDVPIQGTVIDARMVKTELGPRLLWIIETTEPTKAHTKGQEQGTEYPPGSVIAVGHTAKLAPLMKDYMVLQNFDVKIKGNGQKKIGGGKKLWLYQYAMAGGEVRRVALTPAQLVPESRQLGPGPTSGSQNVEDAEYTDDIPF